VSSFTTTKNLIAAHISPINEQIHTSSLVEGEIHWVGFF